jgi:hypothetical protein
LKKLLFLLLFFAGTNLISHAQSPVCQTSNGAISDTRECTFLPEEYSFTTYEIGLCTSQPNAPSAGTPFNGENCSVVFTNIDGADTTLTDLDTQVNLQGEISRPPNAIYTYAYAVLSPTLSLKTSIDFTANRTATYKYGTDGTGTRCWTTASDLWGYSNDPWGNLNEFVFVACGSSTTPKGRLNFHFNSFWNQSQFINTAIFPIGSAYLITNLQELATVAPSGYGDWGDVNKLLWIAPITATAITDQVAGLQLRLNLREGAKVKGSGLSASHSTSDPIRYLAPSAAVMVFSPLY